MPPMIRLPGTSLALAALTLCACPKLTVGDDVGSMDQGSAGANAQRANCQVLDGVYQVSYTMESGSCGAQPSERVEFRSGQLTTSSAQSCQGGAAMVNACDYARDQVCSVSDPLSGGLQGMMRITCKLSEVSGPDLLQGQCELTVQDTNQRACMSTYTVSASRLD
jgi:hypothetical protein